MYISSDLDNFDIFDISIAGNALKNLILIRHAKSDWGDPNLRDMDRPLNQRGLRNAPKMGLRLAQTPLALDAFFCSPAKRAIDTATLITKALAHSPSVTINPALYDASSASLLRTLQQTDNRHVNIAILGHNPGLTEFANALTGEQLSNIPTCGMVHIRFNSHDWASITPGCGRMEMFDYPKRK